MKDITTRLMEADPTLLLYQEGKWNTEAIRDSAAAEPGNYTSFNDAGVETETGEFLYSMVRILKPEHVLETGTHWGVGASYMASGLRDNNKGKLTTIEFLPEIYNRARLRFEALGLSPWIKQELQDVAQYQSTDTYKLILLDTEPQTRFAELIKFFPSLEPGGFVFIHDLHQHMHQIDNVEHGFAWPYGKLPQDIIDMVNADDLRPFHFSTPRGLTGFYKPHPGDYTWR